MACRPPYDFESLQIKLVETLFILQRSEGRNEFVVFLENYTLSDSKTVQKTFLGQHSAIFIGCIPPQGGYYLPKCFLVLICQKSIQLNVAYKLGENEHIGILHNSFKILNRTLYEMNM